MGEIIKKKVDQMEITKTKVAEALQIKDRQLYNLFKMHEVKLPYVAKIGKVIKYDFSQDFPELKKHPDLMYIMGFGEVTEVNDDGGDAKYMNIKQCMEEREHWIKKYVALLEEHNNLLRQVAYKK